MFPKKVTISFAFVMCWAMTSSNKQIWDDRKESLISLTLTAANIHRAMLSDPWGAASALWWQASYQNGSSSPSKISEQDWVFYTCKFWSYIALLLLLEMSDLLVWNGAERRRCLLGAWGGQVLTSQALARGVKKTTTTNVFCSTSSLLIWNINDLHWND